MEYSIVGDLDRQISCAQETLLLCNSIKEKLSRLESEKKEALNKCIQLEARLERIKEEKCSNCEFLLRKLNKERIEKEKFKKEEKAKLLKTIAKTLESIEDGNTNHMTNAQQLFTQLVFDGFDGTGDKNRVTLIQDNASDDEDCQHVLADETVIAIESEDSSNEDNSKCERAVSPVVVPETECQASNRRSIKQILNIFKPSGHVNVHQGINKEENITPEEDCEIQHVDKKPKYGQMLPPINGRSNTSRTASTSTKTSVNMSPSANTSKTSGSGGVSLEEPSTLWKLKPSFLVEPNAGSAASGKRMKQMTLNLTRPEKKHDISLSEKFKGGVTSNHNLPADEEQDVVLPSPDRALSKFFSKKAESCETLQDPDLTVFQPGITSTCHPLETSFDKVPEKGESPPFKYRRETVRGKEKRLKLPGQDCDECAEYYKAAGLDKTQDMKLRMNGCSRHRDKYQIRAHTPPGFWDPVLPISPGSSQENS